MDSRYPREGNTRKRTRLRQMCSLCNEPSLPAKEQLKHFTSAVHRHMKQIKQKQFSYTKNLRTLEEKINASEEQNEPVIGLEYVYQYAADKRGVVPYVCMLCECVYKIDTIFFHIVGVQHRSLYLSKNFPAMGIDRNFRVKTSSEYRKLLNAAEIVEKSHGRKKINVFNTLFNPKKNVGMKYDLESAGEGLSSSEDEQDNPDSAATTSITKPFHTDERKTLRSGVGDNNDRSLNRRGNPQFQGDRKGGPPLPDDGSVGPPFQYDGRRGPEVLDGHSGMNRSLRDHDNSGFQHDGHRGHYNHEDLELSYQQRGPDGRKAPGRRDFPDDRNPNSQMHRGGEAFQYSDRQGPPLQGDPRHDNNQVRNNDGDLAFQHGQSTRSRGNPHSDFDLPPMGLLPQQVDCDDIKGQNRTQSRPPGFSGDRDLQSQMHRGGTAFQYDRPDPILQGGPRHPDNGFDFRHNENTRSLGKPRDDYDMPSLGPLRKQVNHKDESHPPDFPGDRNLGSRIHRDGKAFQYNDRQGPEFQVGARLTDKQVRTNNREFAFKHDESIQSPGNSGGDLDMPSMGPLHQGQSMTPSYAPDFPGDPNLRSQMHRDGMAFQYNDRRGPTLPGGPRDIGNQLRNDDRDFAFQRDQSTRLLGSAHGDLNMPSMGPLHQQGDHDDSLSHNRTQNRPPGVFGDHDLQSQMHRDDGMGFQCDDRQRPLLRDGPRQTGNQVRENNNDRRTRWDDPHADPNMPSLGPLRKQVESDDLRSLSRTQNHPPDFPGDHKLITPMHRNEFQYGDRPGPMLHGDPRHTDHQLKNNDRAFAFQHDQSARLLDDAHGDPKMPSMGLLHQQEDRSDIMGRNRTQNRPPDFSGVRNLGSRMHRNGMEFQCDDHDLQSQMDRGGMAFPYDNLQGEMPHGDLSHSNNLMDKTNRGFQPDHQRPQLLPNVPTMNSSSFYQQGDRHVFEERSSAEDRRQGFSEDRSLHSQNPQGGMGHDNRSGGDNRFLMRGDFLTYQELKTAYQSGLGQGHGGLDEQDVTYDSDMEVCSMELSDCDPDAFLCNAELFEFLKTFHILSYEDEQFALKVRDMFTSSTIRYKNLKEQLLKRRIAEEKERLEEEKKAFLEVRRAKERPKKERPKPSAPAPNKKYAPAPNSISKPLLPNPTSSNAGLAIKPTPLMSLLVDPIHPPGAANSLQHSPGKSRPKGSEQRPPTMPAMNIHPERQSRWDQESLQTSSEMHLEERFSVPSQREDLFHSRGRIDAARNLPPRFPPHTAKY